MDNPSTQTSSMQQILKSDKPVLHRPISKRNATTVNATNYAKTADLDTDSLPASPSSQSGASTSHMALSTSSLLSGRSTKSQGTLVTDHFDEISENASPTKLDKESGTNDIDWKFASPNDAISSIVLGPLEAIHHPAVASIINSLSSVQLAEMLQQISSPTTHSWDSNLQALVEAFQSVLYGAHLENEGTHDELKTVEQRVKAMSLTCAHIAIQFAAECAAQQELVEPPDDGMELTTLGPIEAKSQEEDKIDKLETKLDHLMDSDLDRVASPAFKLLGHGQWESEDNNPTAFFNDFVEETVPLHDSEDEPLPLSTRRHTVSIMQAEQEVVEPLPEPRRRGQSLVISPPLEEDQDDASSVSSEGSNYSAQMSNPRSRSHSQEVVEDQSWDERDDYEDDDEPVRRTRLGTTGRYKKRYANPVSPHKPRDWDDRPKKQVDLSNRAFKCMYCDSAFVRKHDLKRHERIHLGIKPYSCNMCGKSFSRLDAMNRHCVVRGCKQGDEDAAPPRRKKSKVTHLSSSE